jgi:hypothetical protein
MRCAIKPTIQLYQTGIEAHVTPANARNGMRRVVAACSAASEHFDAVLSLLTSRHEPTIEDGTVCLHEG